MVYLFDIALDSGTEYVCFGSETAITYDGNSYLPIVDSIEGLQKNQGEKTYEISTITIILLDSLSYFRNLFLRDSNKYFTNKTITTREADGTVYSTTKIDSWSFPSGKFLIGSSLKIDMEKDFTEKINTTTWANAAAESIDKVVPMAFNTITNLPAWQVNDVIPNGDWLLGKKAISSITAVRINGITIDPALYSLGNDGTYWWVNMGHGVLMGMSDVAHVDITTAAYTPVQIVSGVLTGTVTVAANADFSTFLSNQGYTSSNVRYLLNKPISPAEFLTAFCNSVESDWRFNAAGEIEFTWINRSSPITTYYYQTGEILGVEQINNYEPTEIKNKIKYWYNLNYKTDSYTSFDVYNGANQGDAGVYDDEVEFEFLTESVQAAVTVVERYQLNREPGNLYQIIVAENASPNIMPGDTIKAAHEDMITSNHVFYKVKRVIPGNEEGTIVLEVEEMNYVDPTFYMLAEDGQYMLDEAGYRIKIG